MSVYRLGLRARMEPFTDEQLNGLAKGHYGRRDPLVKRLLATLDDRKRKMNERLEAMKAECSLRKEVMEAPAIEAPEPRVRDQNETCVKCGKRWFVKLGTWRLCTKCGNWYEARQKEV